MAALTKALIALCGFFAVCRSQLELDERFMEYRKHGMWLIEFYAPWCGHCKKLDPIYREVAKELQHANSQIRVAKLDCTRFSNIASEFSVRGFPTIMFVNGDKTFTHRGDRTKEDIVEFALRAQGPAVRKLSSVGKFNEARSQHSDSVFFVYIGDGDEQEDLFKKYNYAAEAHVIHSYFYYGKKHIIENGEVKRHPTLLVFKDERYYEFDPPDGVVTANSVQHWINRERYPSFPRMSGPGLNEMVSVAKYLVILAAEPEELNDPSTSSSRLFNIMKELALRERQTFHSHFQFLWMQETETVDSIAMSFLSAPVFMVLETQDNLYYMPPGSENLTLNSMAVFLSRVAGGQEQAHGGTGFFMRVRRLLFDFVSTVVSIWQASRLLFLLMFGLPTIIISIICYSLCCMETIDDVPEDEDEDDENDGQYDIPPPTLGDSQELPPYDALGDSTFKNPEEKKKE